MERKQGTVHVKKPAARKAARWRVVIESYTEYSTIVEATSEDEAEALATNLFGEEDDYRGEAWTSLGTLFRVKAMGRARNRNEEPPDAEFMGSDEPGWDVPAALEPTATGPIPARRGRPKR